MRLSREQACGAAARSLELNIPPTAVWEARPHEWVENVDRSSLFGTRIYVPCTPQRPSGAALPGTRPSLTTIRSIAGRRTRAWIPSMKETSRDGSLPAQRAGSKTGLTRSKKPGSVRRESAMEPPAKSSSTTSSPGRVGAGVEAQTRFDELTRSSRRRQAHPDTFAVVERAFWRKALYQVRVSSMSIDFGRRRWREV